MRKKQRSIRIAGRVAATGGVLAGLLAAGPAAADEDRGFYGRLNAGYGFASDSDLNLAPGGSGEAEFDAGFGGGGSVGYYIGPWRMEAELMYRTNDTDKVTGNGLPASASGDFSSLGLGFNLAREFNLLPNPAIRSYVGIGVVWLEEIDLDFETAAGELSYSSDEVAFQGMLGARYSFGPNWETFAELRYLTAGDVELDGEGAAPGKLDAEYNRFSVMFGIGYRF